MNRVIIATDCYAGNFERELCAFITGAVGECGVGREYANFFGSYPPPPIDRSDDRGVMRPVSLCDEDFNSLEIYYDRVLTEEEINVIDLRARLFAAICRNK